MPSAPQGGGGVRGTAPISVTVQINVTPSGKDVAQAKQKAGGGTLFRGRCFGEDGELMALQEPMAGAGLRVPDDDRAIAAGGGEVLAIGAVGDAPHVAIVAHDGARR